MLPNIPSSLDAMSPIDVVRWAADTVGADHLVVTASFEDAVLVHVAATAIPGVEIVLLDTQYLFAETKWLVDELTHRLDLNLRVIRPDVAPDNLWQTDTERCCELRKVIPLQRSLEGRAGWITGVRRADGPTRAHTPVAVHDPVRGVLKVNPLATFSDDDMLLYQKLHDLPANPLTARGYPSIGCWPCTRPVAPGEDRRAGRWSDSAKTECGLHQ